MSQKGHNVNLDILRGLAALIVVFRHLTTTSEFSNGYGLTRVLNYNFPAQLSVLVFFVLSGYVIQINTKPLTNKENIIGYIKKRIVRIFPIYLIAVFMALCITQPFPGWDKILSNVFCFSVFTNNVLDGNGPIWSLQYELLYYTLFIFISYFKVNMSILRNFLIGLIAINFIADHFISIHPLFTSFSIGFLFWLSGAIIAENKKNFKSSLAVTQLIAITLMLFYMQTINIYGPIMKLSRFRIADFSNFSWFQQSISFQDLFYFPFCLALIAALSNTAHKHLKLIVYAFFFVGFLKLGSDLHTLGLKGAVSAQFYWPVLFYVSSLVLWFANTDVNKKIKSSIKSTFKLSSISYAMYIIHMPLLLISGKIVLDSNIGASIKTVVFFIVLFSLAYFLELVLQPRIKKIFLKR